MRCWECGTDFDELNESQPLCPACGAFPSMGRDDDDACALLDDAALIAAAHGEPEYTDRGLGLGPGPQEEPVRVPLDLHTARDGGESRLLPPGQATFDLTEGFRIFPLPTS